MTDPASTFKFVLPDLISTDLRKFYDFEQISAEFYESCVIALAIVTHGLMERLDVIKISEGVSRSKVPFAHWCVNVSAVVLKNVIGNNYTKVLQFLESAGFIGRSNGYVVSSCDTKGLCKAIWLKPEYARYYKDFVESRINKKEVDGSARVIGKMRAVKIKTPRLIRKWGKFLGEIKQRHMNDPIVAMCHEELEHFTIDEKAFDDTIASLRQKGMSSYKENIERQKKKRFDNAKTDENALYVKHDQYGRIHTNVTSLKREIRLASMRCDGSRIGEVDIKSSQAAGLYSLLNLCYNKAGHFTAESDLEALTFVNLTPFWNDYNYDTVMWDWYNELQKYEHLLSNGRIYEFFAEGMSSVAGREITRKEAKKGFMEYLFGKAYNPNDTKEMRRLIREVWKTEFPVLTKCINAIKHNNYKALAHELQKTESVFVFNVICPKIKSEIGCHFCTVHDSIMVPMEYTDKVKALIDRELHFLGIPTMTEIEYEAYDQAMGNLTYTEKSIYREMERDYAMSGENLSAAL